MDKQGLVFGLALVLMAAGYISRVISPENQMIGHVLVGLGAIGGVVGFSMKSKGK